MLTQERSNVILNSSSSLDGEQERYQRDTETQFSNSLNVRMRKGQSLGLSLGHDKDKYRRNKPEEEDHRVSFEHVRSGGYF